MKLSLTTLLVALLVFAPGCSTRTETYDLTVHNRSSKPVIVWLTKNGPPYDEPGWKSPEVIAIESNVQEPKAGVLIPPGQSAETGAVKGTFAGRTAAVLRVYTGSQKFNELLAMSEGSPDRKDVVLRPGASEIVIENGQGSAVDVNVRAAPRR